MNYYKQIISKREASPLSGTNAAGALRFFLASALLLALCASVLAKPKNDIVKMYTNWDSQFFYAAFIVNDPDIQGDSRLPNSPVADDDDAVAVYFQTDRDRVLTVNNNSYRMIVSAAGGCQFAVGDNGQWMPRSITTFKYAVKPHGTLNNDQDDDLQYIVEIAVPWREMGITPDVGHIMLFNAVVQMKGEHSGFISFSPDVTSDADRTNPSKWLEMWLRGPVQVLLPKADGRIFINRTMDRSPTIDGRIASFEYPEKTSVEITKPPLTTARHILRDYPVENIVFASYWFPKHDSEMMMWPLQGIGPWSATSSVDWHVEQLRDVRRAGIDALLPVVSPSRNLDIELTALLTALRALKDAGEDYPMLSVMLDFTDSDSLNDHIWTYLESFYRLVSPEFQLQVRLPLSKGGDPALVVFTKGIRLTAEDRQLLDSKSLARFGCRLAVISSDTSVADGFVPQDINNGFAVNGDGWIKIAAIMPGKVATEAIVPRKGGETYLNSWAELAKSEADWVLIDSFNNWNDATAVAASAQYGLTFVDSTSIQLLKYNATLQYSAKYLSAHVPKVVSSSGLSVARLTVRNSGAKPWRVSDRILLTYRWYQGGRLYSHGVVRVPLQKDVPLNSTTQMAVGITALDSDREPLPEGDWLLVFDLVSPDGKLFSDLGDRPLAVPITVSAPGKSSCVFLEVSVAGVLSPGSVHRATISLRNDSPDPLSTAGGYGLLMAASGLDGKELANWTMPFTQEITPGVITSVPVNLDLKSDRFGELLASSGQPYVPVLIKAQLTKGGVPVDGQVPLGFVVRLSPADYGFRLTGPVQPVKGHEYGKKTKFVIEVANTGKKNWEGHNRIVGKLYSLDGVLLDPECGAGRLKNLKPGESVSVNVEMESPPYPGQYVVVWSVEGKDFSSVNLSDGVSNRGVFRQHITVNGPAAEALDLSALLDSDVIASETNPYDGQMADESAFATETMPPFVVPTPVPSSLYPLGYMLPDVEGPEYKGVKSRKWISFAWPSKAEAAKNAVTAAGQVISFSPARVVKAHILAAAAGPAVDARFGMIYSSGEKKLTARVGSWTDSSSGSVVAFRAPVSMTTSGPVYKPACVFSVELPVEVGEALTGIRLPSDPSIRIIAITLEKTVPQTTRK